MRLLLAGFEPFAGLAENPSALLATALAASPPDGVLAVPMVLPVEYARAWPDLLAGIGRHGPDMVIATGLAGGRAGLSVERLAINLDDGAAADNAGEQRRDRPILAGAPLAYAATLPVRAMVAASLAAGVPASVSLSAGSFVCNHVFFRLCHHVATEQPGLRCGFVHVPWLPEQADAALPPGQANMPLDDMVAGLAAMIGASRVA